MDKTCMYHEDKLGFEDLRKELQKGKWIPRQYAQRLAMAVCACRKNIVCQPADVMDLERYKSCIHAKLSSSNSENEDSHTFSPNVRRYITDCLTNTTNTQYSKCRFLKILYNAINRNFYLLTRAAISSNEPVKTDVKKMPQKITPAIKLLIEKRKKKKMEVKLVKLPMFAGNAKRLETVLHESVFDYSRRKGCYVEYDKVRNDESFKRKTTVCYIKVYSDNPVAFKLVRDDLVEKAREAQKIMDEAAEKRRIYRAVQKARCNDPNYQNIETFEDSVMYNPNKEIWHKGFHKKTINNSRGRGGKPHVSVLQGGRCLQCLKSFTSLKDSSQCRYHPGYLVSHGVESMWTCCGQLTDEDVATYDEHKSTGCTEADQHTWRVHQNADRKSLNWSSVGPEIPKKCVKKRATKHLYLRAGKYDDL